jgi:hypothetical protein
LGGFGGEYSGGTGGAGGPGGTGGTVITGANVGPGQVTVTFTST